MRIDWRAHTHTLFDEDPSSMAARETMWLTYRATTGPVGGFVLAYGICWTVLDKRRQGGTIFLLENKHFSKRLLRVASFPMSSREREREEGGRVEK